MHDDEIDLPAPRRRSDPHDRVGPAPNLFPADPMVRRNVVLILLAPLALIGLLVLIVHLAASSAEPSYDGGSASNANGGDGYPYGAQDSTDAYGEGGGGDQSTADDTSDDATATDTATDTSDAGGFGADSSSPTATATGPAGVVQQYFAAINQQDYTAAWQLGGDHLDESYQDYSAGFSDTEEDDFTVDQVQGDVVTGDLVAHNDDGSVQTFSGTFTVEDGVITKFDIRQTD